MTVAFTEQSKGLGAHDAQEYRPPPDNDENPVVKSAEYAIEVISFRILHETQCILILLCRQQMLSGSMSQE